MPPCCNRYVPFSLIYRPANDAKIDPHAFDGQVGTVVPFPWGREGQIALMLCVAVEVAPDGLSARFTYEGTPPRPLGQRAP